MKFLLLSRKVKVKLKWNIVSKVQSEFIQIIIRIGDNATTGITYKLNLKENKNTEAINSRGWAKFNVKVFEIISMLVMFYFIRRVYYAGWNNIHK